MILLTGYTVYAAQGDSEWLRRVLLAITSVQQASPTDIELAQQSKLATDWINARLEHP
jgi:hypothetical protein